MKKYSTEWKKAKGAWIQPHHSERWGKHWRVHWIQYDTEFHGSVCLTRAEAENELENLKRERGQK